MNSLYDRYVSLNGDIKIRRESKFTIVPETVSGEASLIEVVAGPRIFIVEVTLMNVDPNVTRKIHSRVYFPLFTFWGHFEVCFFLKYKR